MVDGQPHTVTVSDLSEAGVTTAIRYGHTAEGCTLTSAPNYTEAGDYPVYYEITYTFQNIDMVEDGVAYVHLRDESTEETDGDGSCGEDHNRTLLDSVAPTCLTLGYALVTATHAATGISESVSVNAATLKDKFYLFQVSPAGKTTLKYTNGDNAQRTVTTNEDGVLAPYEPSGIASDVQLSSEIAVDGTATEYLGTIPQEELLSGEGDATKLQLYPPEHPPPAGGRQGGADPGKARRLPLGNSAVTVRGGVFKNGLLCEDAGLGTNRKSDFDNAGDDQRESGTAFTTDETGKITVCFNANQFTTVADEEPGLLPSDKIQYVLEISGISDNAYYPLFQTVDGAVSPLKEMRTASSVVVLEEVPDGEQEKPFIAQQTVTYYNTEDEATQTMDVRRSTGYVGPNSTFPTAELNTVVLAWGVGAEDEYTANRYNLTPRGRKRLSARWPEPRRHFLPLRLHPGGGARYNPYRRYHDRRRLGAGRGGRGPQGPAERICGNER